MSRMRCFPSRIVRWGRESMSDSSRHESVSPLCGRDSVARVHPKHKRLKEFTVDDYDTLLNKINLASLVLVTPNTLTETSNLAAYIGEPAKSSVFEVLRLVIAKSKETYIPSRTAAGRDEFIRLGLGVVAEVGNSPPQFRGASMPLRWGPRSVDPSHTSTVVGCLRERGWSDHG
jgi:hypothetical protein